MSSEKNSENSNETGVLNDGVDEKNSVTDRLNGLVPNTVGQKIVLERKM